MSKPRKQYSKLLLVFGILLCLGPFWGFLASLVQMIFTFHEMADIGTAQPEELAARIGYALTSGMIGLVAVPFGIGVLIYTFASARAVPPPIRDFTQQTSQ